MTAARPDPQHRLRRRNLAEDVADHIREEILTGRLKPGTRLDQDAVAADLGVSRLPVREAVIALHQEGLLRTAPRRGAWVQPLHPDDVADHYEIFGHVAGLAAAKAAARLTDDDLVELRRLHEAMQNSTDSEEHGRLNFEFHRVVNAAGSSRRLASVLRLLTRSLPVHYYEFVPGWHKAAIAQHEEILGALEARDAEAAQRAMERHLRHSAERAVEELGKQGLFDTSEPD
jgi:DNA-binding GntR family transcriptional regulator